MKKIFSCIVFCMISVPFYIHSQTTTPLLDLLLEKELITLSEAQDLKNREKKTEEIALSKFKTAFQSECFRLSGYGQLLFTVTENPQVAGKNTHNFFNIQRAILFGTGKINDFSYMLMYDFGPRAMLHELYGEWNASSLLNIRAGQFKIPFTIENPMSPTRVETIHLSYVATAFSGSIGDINQDKNGAKAGRDAGIMLSGKVKRNNSSLLEYYAGLFNGTGINTTDNNNHKDFAGSIYYKPLTGIQVGGSLYAGKTHYSFPAEENPRNIVRNRWAISMELKNNPFLLRSEFVKGNDGGISRQGIYAVGLYKIVPEKLEIVAKYDYYEDKGILEVPELKEFTGGINYYFGYLSRIQLNYIYTDKTGYGNNNSIVTQLQLFF